MQHPLQISRKIEYGLRAMLFMASQPAGTVVSFREIARRMNVPESFLSKIMKTLAKQGLATSSRGSHGGYALGRPASEISFLEVIEAVEGPIQLNVCTDTHSASSLSFGCTMSSVRRAGQEQMLEVFRAAKLDKLAMPSLRAPAGGLSLTVLGQPPQAMVS